MPNRPFSCSQCHKTFKNESGRDWHVAHAHDIRSGLDSIRAEHRAKEDALLANNQELSRENEGMRFKQLAQTMQDIGTRAHDLRVAIELKQENESLHNANVALTIALVSSYMQQPQNTVNRESGTHKP